MTYVTLPTTPGPRSIAWEPVDFGTTQRGPLGGASQRINRLGNRWAMHVEMPVLTDAQAREWSAALTAGLRNGVLMEVLQPDLTIGSPGTPLVNGAGQAGTSLAADGFSASHELVAGQFFSVIVSSRRYVHQLSADVTASAGGAATLPITPALRVSPADNATLEFAAPYIEGLLRDVPSWSIGPDRLARGFAFTIEEAK